MTWTCPNCERAYPDSGMGVPKGAAAMDKAGCKVCYVSPAGHAEYVPPKSTTDDLREAFIAGFMVTAEGFNGEYARSLSADPEEQAAEQFEMWDCGHEFTEWEYQRDATHDNRELWVRECKHCPESEWEFREADT